MPQYYFYHTANFYQVGTNLYQNSKSALSCPYLDVNLIMRNSSKLTWDRHGIGDSGLAKPPSPLRALGWTPANSLSILPL